MRQLVAQILWVGFQPFYEQVLVNIFIDGADVIYGDRLFHC